MIHLITGNEPYLIRNKVGELTKGIEDIDILNATELNEDVVSELKTTSLLSEKRLVILKINNLKELNNDMFLGLLDEMPENDLIVVFNECDNRTTFYKELNKRGLIHSYNKDIVLPKLKSFILSQAKKSGAEFEEGALELFLLLENYSENDDVKLDNLISDLSSIISLNKRITKENIEKVVNDNSILKVFSLMGMINKKDISSINKQVDLMGSDIIGPMAAILREYRIAYKNAIGNDNIFSKFPMSADKAKKGIEILTKGLEDAKTSGYSKSLLFKEVCYKLINLQ